MMSTTQEIYMKCRHIDHFIKRNTLKLNNKNKNLFNEFKSNFEQAFQNINIKQREYFDSSDLYVFKSEHVNYILRKNESFSFSLRENESTYLLDRSGSRFEYFSTARTQRTIPSFHENIEKIIMKTWEIEKIISTFHHEYNTLYYEFNKQEKEDAARAVNQFFHDIS